MQVSVKNLQKKILIRLPQITRITKAILACEGVKTATLSIVFVTSLKIRALNRKYLNRDYVTDVLAFDLGESKGSETILYGDIAICVDAAISNAKIYNTSLSEELTLYVVHGILHLIGFDDHVSSDIQRMRKKEKEVMEYLGNKINIYDS